MRRFLFGLIAYIVGSFVLQFALLAANGAFRLHLERPPSFIPAGTPIIGGVSGFILIYLVLLIGLLCLLYRIRILPRENDAKFFSNRDDDGLTGDDQGFGSGD